MRARKHWTTLRQRWHERFDQWLDQLESALLPEGAPTLGQVSETVWTLRQPLTSGVAETIVHHTHQEEQHRPHMPCPTCPALDLYPIIVPKLREPLIAQRVGEILPSSHP